MKPLNGTTIIAEITLVREDGRGWIAELNNGETAWVIGDTRELCDSVQGDVIIAALEKHNRHPAPHWHAAWSVPKGDVTVETVDHAYKLLVSDGPCTSGEIGPAEGDLLCHGGKISKFVPNDRRFTLDPDNDIWYMLNYKKTIVVEEDE